MENVEVVVLSDDIFHVTWDPPLSPNGVLTGYHILVTDLINSSEIFTNVVPVSVQKLNVTSGIGKLAIVSIAFLLHAQRSYLPCISHAHNNIQLTETTTHCL